MKNILTALLLISTTFAFSQGRSAFNKSRNWKQNKYEVYFSLGATTFLGDLGGLNREGTQKSIVDMDLMSTRMGGSAGYRYRIGPRWATSSQLFFGMVSGDDAHTEEIVRRSRNLSFRSPILEIGQRLEFVIYANEQMGRQRSKVLNTTRNNVADVLYIFTGAKGIFFNPQTKINGTWTNLRDLKTEGQGLPGGAKEYSRVNFAIPLGIGFKFGISDFWRLGIEVSYNKTFTDYIDDVSTDYYDPAILNSQVGANSVYAANPAIENHGWFAAGNQRGNPKDKDAYVYTSITLTRNITFNMRR